LSGSKKFAAPRPATEVPGPVIGLRTLDGKWIGGSRLYGERKIAGYGAVTETGPVFAKATITYKYANGETLVATIRVVAGQEVVFMGSVSEAHRPSDGWRIILSRGFEAPVLSLVGEYANRWGLKHTQVGHIKLSNEPAGVVYNLVPWEDWWKSTTRTAFALSWPKSKTVLALGSYDPAAWRDPADKAMLGMSYEKFMQFKYMPLVKSKSGDVYLECSAEIGARKWYVGFLPKKPDLDDSYQDARALHNGKYGCQTLDMVKDYVLDWEGADEVEHPCVYVPKGRQAEARRKLGKDVKAIESQFHRYYRKDNNERWRISGRDLFQHMVNSQYWAPKYLETFENNPNRFDLMRHSLLLVNMYDILMGTGELSAAERRLLRAQIAYLGYTLNSPYTWDIDRAYTGDISNMHLSFVCNLGLTACAIPDHPMAKTWAEKAVKWVGIRLNEYVGENGVWTNENTHYARVSLSSMLGFAIGARNAGFHDFLARGGKMRAMSLYLVKQLTPFDPRYKARGMPPAQVVDRCERSGHSGIIAKAMADSDPELSRNMQWAWNQQNNSTYLPNPFVKGFEKVLLDKSLPEAVPAWRSEAFPGASVILRYGIGTADEYYLALATHQFGNYYLSQPGGVTIYARGKPLAMIFSGSYEVCTSEDFLTNSVSLARAPGSKAERIRNRGRFGDGKIYRLSAMPRQDYVSTVFDLNGNCPVRSFFKNKMPDLPTPWARVLKRAGGTAKYKRQVLFIKGARPRDPSYFVFRDTVKGGQPTVWSMWTLSEKIGAPDEVKDLDAFLADAPGRHPTPARELKGDRFTAVGQFGVDVEYYVALPTDTPRQTVRWGYDSTRQWPNPWHEYQDLLHLQRTDDGAYFVAFFPRDRNEPSPEFSTLADGKIIMTKGLFGTDYAFLYVTPTTASAEGVAFSGMAGSVQDRADGLVLALGARGEMTYKGYELSSKNGPASVTIAGGKVTVSTPPDRIESRVITLTLPDGQTLAPSGKVRVSDAGRGAFDITIPKDIITARLTIAK